MRIPNIFERFQAQTLEIHAAWLILGKGPSFSMCASFDTTGFRIFTLNDAITSVSHAAIAHFIDFDAFKRCVHTLDRADAVVLPWYPHFNDKPKFSLAELLSNDQGLQRLLAEGRLCWYDLSTSTIRHGAYPVVSARYFSAEAALDLLAIAGVRRIRSLGVDGGNTYSEAFSDLSSVSLLSNRHSSFNQQFKSFADVILRTGVDFAPLNMETPIRVFVAATLSEALPFKVLEYSIRRHASTTVRVVPLHDAGISIPQPRAPENRPRTPFSFQRFLIPQVCGYAGHAIYLDSDMLVFKDITDLWRRPLGEANLLSAYSASTSGRKPQYSVMLMDCSRLNWQIDDIVAQLDEGSLSYEQLMYAFSIARTKSDIEPDWNALESYKAGQTALLHYTDMNTQPWVSHLNPLGYLWVRSLRQALDSGAITRAFIEDEVRKGHVRPSLLYQLDHEIEDSILLPKVAVAADAQFIAPFRSLGLHSASPWKNRWLWMRAIFRAGYQKTPIYRLHKRIIQRLEF